MTYNTDKSRWRYCDHPRIPSNTAKSGPKGVTCYTCKLERGRKRWKEHRNEPQGGRRKHRLPIYRRPPELKLPRFELVSVQPLSESQNGRSYSQFPLKRRSA